MNRRKFAGLIFLIWAGALGWLGARELGRPNRPALSAERTISPSAAFYAVTAAGTQLGFASTTVDTTASGLVVDDRLVLELAAGDNLLRADIRTVATLSNSMTLESFITSAGAPRGRFEIRGTVEGDTSISLSIVSETEEHPFELATNGPVVLTNHVPVFLSSSNQLITGTQTQVTAIDPFTLTIDTLNIEVAEDSTFFSPDSAAYDSSTALWMSARVDTVQAWRVRTTSAAGESERWVDRLGRLVSLRSASGPDLDRTAFEIAFNNFRARDTENVEPKTVVLASAIAAQAGLPADLGSATFVVRGIGNLVRGGTPRQEWAGDTVTITVDPDSSLETSYRMPYDADALAHYLADELPYTSENPFVQAQARLAVDGTRNPRTAVRRLIAWTNVELSKEVVPSVPAAVEILNARRGDAADHAALFVAMSRAVGVPARPLAGVVLIDGTLYLHAWAEVFLGKAWVAADPTFGKFPAGAAYVRLLEGSGTVPALVDRLAQLDMDVVETRE
jgi:hypothetical protein